MYTRSILLLAVSMATLLTSPVQAQLVGSNGPTLVVMAGKTEYDLSRVGTRNLVALRVQVPVSQHLRIEPGVTYMNQRVSNDLPVRWHLTMPEVQVQGAFVTGRIEPYLGVGAGAAIGSIQGKREVEFTLSAAGGIHFELGNGWGMGGELRLRAIDPWTGSTADWGVSLRKRL